MSNFDIFLLHITIRSLQLAVSLFVTTKNLSADLFLHFHETFKFIFLPTFTFITHFNGFSLLAVRTIHLLVLIINQ